MEAVQPACKLGVALSPPGADKWLRGALLRVSASSQRATASAGGVCCGQRLLLVFEALRCYSL